MVKKRLKVFITVVGLVAVAATIIYQQTRIDRLTSEAAVLREQIQRQPSVQKAPEDPAPRQPVEKRPSTFLPSPAGEQSPELLRLRGEVGVLRRRMDEAVEREASQQTQYQAVAGRVDSARREEARAIARAALMEENQEKLTVWAKNTLSELASALDIPDSVSKLNSDEALRDESLKQYFPYFYFKRACERMQAAIESQKPRSQAE